MRVVLNTEWFRIVLIGGLLLLLAIVGTGCTMDTGEEQAPSPMASIAESTDWALLGNSPDMQHHSGLSQINTETVSDLGIAFLELREIGPDGTYGHTDVPKLSPQIREVFQGPLILNSDFDSREKAQAALDSGVADAIAFGRTFLANPDLPERLRTGAPLNQSDMATWYSQGPEGYIDYPTLDEQSRAA